MQPIGSYWDAGSPWSPVSENSCAKPAGLQKGLFENTVAVRCSLPQIITMLVECKERPFLIPCFFFFCIEVASMSHYAPSGSKASQMLELVSRFWTNSEASWEFHQMRDDAGPGVKALLEWFCHTLEQVFYPLWAPVSFSGNWTS